MNAVKLSDLSEGENGRVLDYSSDQIPTKIYHIGLVPGVDFKMFKKAPFNGPICICLGSKQCKLALRKEEANEILVEKI